MRLGGLALAFTVLFFSRASADELDKLLGLAPPNIVNMTVGGASNQSSFLSLGAQLNLYANTSLLLNVSRSKSTTPDENVNSQRGMIGFATDPMEDLSGEISYQYEYDLTKIYFNRSYGMRLNYAPSRKGWDWIAFRLGGDNGTFSSAVTPLAINNNRSQNDYAWNSLDLGVRFYLGPRWTLSFSWMRAWYPGNLNNLGNELAYLFVPAESISFATSLPSETRRFGATWNMPYWKRRKPYITTNIETSKSSIDGSTAGTLATDFGLNISKKWSFRTSVSASKTLGIGEVNADSSTVNRSLEFDLSYKF